MKLKELTSLGGSLKGFRLPKLENSPTPAKGQLVISGETMMLGDGRNFVPAADIRDFLFPFVSHKFVSNTVGHTGPTDAVMRALYPQAWAKQSIYLANRAGQQVFTVPANGLYEIEICGASRANMNAGVVASRARVKARFDLKQGDKLYILVGQRGTTAVNNTNMVYAGGAGGTFVALNTATSLDALLLVAGGTGSSVSPSSSSGSASVSTSERAGSYITSDGTTSRWSVDSKEALQPALTFYTDGGAVYGGNASGGGGATQNGLGSYGGRSYISGGQGGNANSNFFPCQGGFGGGGGGYVVTSGRNGYFCPGAGGYTGGNASGAGYGLYFHSGGGGCYRAPSAKNGVTSIVTAGNENGYCLITLVG